MNDKKPLQLLLVVETNSEDKTDVIYMYYYTEDRLITSILEILEDNDKLKVVYTFNFRNSNPKYVSQAMENISDLDYKFEFDTLYIWQKDNLLFNKVTPAIPLYI